MQQHIAQMVVNFVDIIAAIGLTIIVTQSFLFKKMREYLSTKNKYLGKLFSCTMCFGFWSIFVVLFFKFLLPIVNLGFITSLLCYIVYLLIKPLMNKYD